MGETIAALVLALAAVGMMVGIGMMVAAAIGWMLGGR